MSTLQKYCTYHQYDHPNKFNPHDKMDFLVVTDRGTFDKLYAHFLQLGETMPPIIHLADPKDLDLLNYSLDFPTLKIAVIPQEPLNDFGGTLKFDSFYQAIRRLRQEVDTDQLSLPATEPEPPPPIEGISEDE